MRCTRSFAVVALVVVVAMGLTPLAMAQNGDARRAAFEAGAKLPTTVSGVQVFAAPPKNFDPLTASAQELWKYGLPEAPDKTAHPAEYQHWAKAMTALKIHPTDVEAKPFSSKNLMSAGNPGASVDGAPTSTASYNWSGIANTNKLKTWSNKTSFDEVVSFFNVPVANPPFGSVPCADGPWYEVTWNGIDGFSNGDVVQGGSLDYWDGGGCKGSIEYIGWVEWYPSYAILQIDCGKKACKVGPGDDFEVVTFGAPGTATQSVFVEDITQEWGGTFTLAYVSGPGLVGSSAEYIVERPCCNGNGFPLPLANYVLEFMGYNYAVDGAGTLFYPGSTATSTYIITMVADDGSTGISVPAIYGSTGNAGRYSITLEDENCAASGGCTP
jgi:Peptidase A4 family